VLDELDVETDADLLQFRRDRLDEGLHPRERRIDGLDGDAVGTAGLPEKLFRFGWVVREERRMLVLPRQPEGTTETASRDVPAPLKATIPLRLAP
jgi:hypothetical protein